MRRDLTPEHDAVWRVPDCLVEDTQAHAAHGDRGHIAPRPGEAASTGWRGIGARRFAARRRPAYALMA
jgi:hypothetical protein